MGDSQGDSFPFEGNENLMGKEISHVIHDRGD